MCRSVGKSVLHWAVLGALVITVLPAGARAGELSSYELAGSFSLPAGAGPMDVLPDGRIVTTAGDVLYVETQTYSRVFNAQGSLPNADIGSFGPAFLRISRDGAKLAIGNNGGASFGNYQVGVFELATLTGDWFAATHFDAAWVDNRYLAISGGTFGNPIVSILDTLSPNPSQPDNRVILVGIGDASGGIAFDAGGNLFTGNGFQSGGPVGTGVVKAFSQTAWMTAYASGIPIDFQSSGFQIIDLLSASPLGFERSGHLLIGGGDFSTPGQFDYVALVHAAAIQAALSGGGPIDADDMQVVRRLDPDKGNNGNFYSFAIAPLRAEFYVRDLGGGPAYLYVDASVVPTASTWGLSMLAIAILIAGTLALQARGGVSRG